MPIFFAHLKILLLMTAVLTACIPSQLVAGSSTVYLVRHAEKNLEGEDPSLNRQGKLRALELARTLSSAGIQRVLSTDFIRTRDTATPLARQLGLEVEIYDHRELQTLADELSAAGGTSLVVGHSNTTPEMVSLLGGQPGEPFEEKTEFNRLYRVVVTADGQVSTTVRRYGAANPEAK